MGCNCEEWKKRSGKIRYAGEKEDDFGYCPWCGRALEIAEPPLIQSELKDIRAILRGKT